MSFPHSVKRLALKEIFIVVILYFSVEYKFSFFHEFENIFELIKVDFNSGGNLLMPFKIK